MLAMMALVAAMYFASAILAPIALGFVSSIVLSPVSGVWRRAGLSAAVGSFLTLLLGLVLLAILILALYPVAAEIYEKAPTIRWEIRKAVYELRGLAEGLHDMSEEVSAALKPAGGDEAPAARPVLPQPIDALLAAPGVLARVMTFVGALYFFLMCRHDVNKTLARLSPLPTEQAIERLESADTRVARYCLTIAMINSGFGVCVGLAMNFLGVPLPVLWAILAALANFVFYVGPAAVAFALLVTGLVAFDGAYSALPAIVFVSLNAIEGQFITPTLVGRNLDVNPLAVFLSLVFFLWLWGPVGGVVAIPLVAWLIILAQSYGVGTRTAFQEREETA